MVEGKGLARSGESLCSWGRDADSPGCEMKLVSNATSKLCPSGGLSRPYWSETEQLMNTPREEGGEASGRGGGGIGSRPHIFRLGGPEHSPAQPLTFAPAGVSEISLPAIEREINLSRLLCAVRLFVDSPACRAQPGNNKTVTITETIVQVRFHVVKQDTTYLFR
jgi:hypothetical protein